MTRLKKQDEEYKLTMGPYNVTKGNDQYVVRLGGDVVYVNPDLIQVHKYLDVVCPIK